ncbi:Dos2-interacting transcription regulator of RNA-Pol-II-domain-containing protein [Cunninghamella echinulata]|nr:Dos2-interacting transcription regulator of RNA-Pol-II-domain-containing protein [Cunninghamella echinulata]
MSLDSYVNNYMIATGSTSAEAISSADNVVKMVNQGAIQENLLQMIQAMGEYLTSEDDFVRAKGYIDHSNFNETAVSVLVNFYCDRLTDKTCVPTILEGLIALTGFPRFNGANAVLVIKRLIECVELQRYPQVTRNAGYQMFKNVVNNHFTALKSINNELVFGYCRLMDGEKDPRNLMIAFEVIRTVINHFDISAHVEDLFEVTFCYFPITFKPPQDDPYGITAEDLKISLRSCLASTPLFAKFAVPLILEKLTSTSGSAKKDSIETLSLCAPIYGSSALLPNIEELLESLKIEILHASDQTIEDASVEGIHSLVKAISPIVISGSAASDPFTKALKPLMDECISNINDAESKYIKQTGRILHAIASASDHACHITTETVVPLLLHNYRESELVTRRKSMMDILIELLEANRTLYGIKSDGKDVNHDITPPMLAYKDRLFGIFESSLLASNEYDGLRLSGLKGLKLMILTLNYLTSNEVGIAIQSFNNVLLEETNDDLRKQALKSLETISLVNPDCIAEQTIPLLINRLPQSSLEKQIIGYLHLLHSLKILCPEPTLFKVALPLLLEKFEGVCDNDLDATYAQAIITTLLDIIYIKATNDHQDISPCFNTVVWPMVTKIVSTSTGLQKTQVLLLPDILESISMIAATIYQKMDSSNQKDNLDKLFKIFVDGDTSAIGLESIEFLPLNAASPDAQHSTILIFAAIVNSARRDVSLPVESIESFLDNLINLALTSSNTILLNSLVRIIGSVINKLKLSETLTTYVKNITSKLQSIIDQQSPERHNALLIYIWIAKALILKTQPLGYQLTDKIIEWCRVPLNQLEAPQGFDHLLCDDHLALTKTCFANSTILYKQRFFSYCLPKLVNGFRTTEDDIKHNYLIALSYLLKNIPKQILLNELPPVNFLNFFSQKKRKKDNYTILTLYYLLLYIYIYI